MKKITSIAPFYRMKRGLKKYGELRITDVNDRRLINSVLQHIATYHRLGEPKKASKCGKCLEPNTGFKFAISSPYSDMLEERVLSEHDNMESISQMIIDENIYGYDS